MKINGKVYDMLHQTSKMNRNLIKNYVYGSCSLSKNRAILLGEACSTLGINITAEQWIFATPAEKKQALLQFCISRQKKHIKNVQETGK